MSETETITRVCPFCGKVLNEEFKACPYCGYWLERKVKQQKGENEDAALIGVIGGFVCLLISWFILGIVFAGIAIGLGWYAVKNGSSVAKVLGGICIVLGIIFFLLSLAGMFVP